MIPYILLVLMVIVYFFSFANIFEKNGRQKWEGYVPIYNIYVWLKILEKPWWWIFFFPIPFVNLIVAIGCNVETARLFGKYSVKDTFLMILLPWYYLPYLAFDSNNVVVAPTDWTKVEDRSQRKWHDQITLFFIAPFVGHGLYLVFRLIGSKDKPNKKTMSADWTNALGFAIVAASIIRSLFFEAFTIPTGSMEKTMRIGDYLFVNKMKYGAKLPQTPISVPFVHNRLPFSFVPSYVDWFSSDYRRLFGYGEIKRGDIMVFNWPVGDSVIVHEGVIAHDYYAILRNQAFTNFINSVKSKKQFRGKPSSYYNNNFEKVKGKYLNFARKNLINGGGLSQSPVGPIEKTGGIATLPVDKKENYIKRCVAVGGDTLEIRDNLLLINHNVEEHHEEVVFTFIFKIKGTRSLDTEQLLEDFEIYSDQISTERNLNEQYSIITCSYDTKEKIEKGLNNLGILDTCFMDINPRGFDYSRVNSNTHQYYPVFPNHPKFNWSRDNFGPLIIPEKGWTVELNDSTWVLYKRAIEVYERNKVSINSNGNYLINDNITSEYTFKQNYYWLMGDNRHGSADSRFWGFVPEDHVVGTASFVWFSKHPETGIRWDRIFSTVH